MTPIQKIELQALKEFEKVAKKNNISFFLRGGSVMGAVKFHGFVPWDDDMDIAVPRKDFDKLIKIFSEDWSDDFWIASYQNGDQIHAYFPRMLVKEKFRKENGLPRNNHLGFSIIDILPLDYVPNSITGRKLFEFKVGVLRALGAVWTFDIKDTVMMHSKARQVVIRALKGTGIQKFYTQNQTYDEIDKIYRKNFGKTNWMGTITGSSFSKELFPSSVWGNGVYLKFEDTQFKVPTEYDKYLKQIYGKDYLQETPPIKKSHITDKRVY